MADAGKNLRVVHVVDDDPAVRDSTCTLLELEGYQVTSWSSGDVFLKDLNLDEAGGVLLDLQMPGASGLDVLKTLARKGSRLSAVVLTGYADIATAVAAMRLGATDFLEKPYEVANLLVAVERAVSISAANRPQTRGAEARALIAKLTPRECQVLQALVDGSVNKSIATELRLSPRTVEMHRANMMDRLGAKSLSDALRIAYEAGLGPIPSSTV